MRFPFQIAGLSGWAEVEVDDDEIAFIAAVTDSAARLDAESLAVLQPARPPVRLSDWLVEQAYQCLTLES